MSGWSIPDHTTRFSAFITGKVHHYGGGSSGLAPAQVDQMQKSYADFDLFPTFYQMNSVHLNALRPPFDDFRVRNAVANVIRRGGVLTRDLGGKASTDEYTKELVKEVKRLGRRKSGARKRKPAKKRARK